MDMKISSIMIKCKEQNIFIQLSNKISFIYGNTSVGKTTLLNLISYGLGNDLIKTLAIEQKVVSICLSILLNGELISLERKINSNSIIMNRNNKKIDLVAKGGKFTSRQSFSDFLYSYEGIEPIEMLRRNSSKEIKVSFSNFMWFSYLRQQELDNTLFYLGEKGNFRELASNYVFKVLLNEKTVSNKEISKEINKLKEEKEKFKLEISIIHEICSSTKIFNVNLSMEIAKKQKEVVQIKQEVEDLKRRVLNSHVITEGLVEELLEKQRRIGIYEAEVRYLIEFSKINEIRNQYLKKIQDCEKTIEKYENRKIEINNELFNDNLRTLETIFFECLLDVGFSYIETTDCVKIDKNTFIPSIFSQYDEFKFDYTNLSSGGKKTIFKICYALAIHIFVTEKRIHSILPKFIIIDTPMKNMSEREDRILYENLYLFFSKLFSAGGRLEKMQLIVVDKELPQIFRGKEIMCKHMTNEKPLLPFLKKSS